MKKPYKIMVWGPGRLGGICIWEMMQTPAFELVGVRAYSESKTGVDVGTLLGFEPQGIEATTDVDALLEIDCDCIVYTAHDRGDFHTDDEILKLLAAGKNVVTPLPYHNAHLFREAAFVEKLEAACKEGGSTFHADGIDPDVMSDRILIGLTGLCTDIEYIKLQESWDCSLAEPGPLEAIGLGKPPEEGQKLKITQDIAANFLYAIGYTAQDVLGVKFDRVEMKHEYITTPEDIDIEGTLFIKAGTVGRIAHRVECYLDEKGPEPFYSVEYNWLMGDTMLPEGVKPGQYYTATIEGRPSLKMALDIKTSHRNNDRVYKVGNLEVEPSYIGTMAPCLQSIPHTCEAAPGILPSFGPGLHWMQDLRDAVKK